MPTTEPSVRCISIRRELLDTEPFNFTNVMCAALIETRLISAAFPRSRLMVRMPSSGTPPPYELLRRTARQPHHGRRSLASVPESITLTDNRSGESVEIPIVDGGVDATEWRKLLPNVWFYD